MTLMFKDHTGAEHDFDALPASARQGMVNRAVSHIFGNECASVVVGKIKAALAGDGKASDVTTAQVQAFRADPANEVKLDSWLSEARDAKIAAIVAGSLGVRVAGGSVDPLEAMMHRIARTEIMQLVGSKNFPRKDGDVYVGAGGKRYEGKDGGDEMAEVWFAGTDTKGRFGKEGGWNAERIGRLAKRELNAKAEAKRRALAEGDESPV